MTSVLLPQNAITVVRGSSKTYELNVSDDAGQSVDLTGARVIFTVKADIEDDDRQILIRKDSANGAGEVDVGQDLENSEVDDPLKMARQGRARIYLEASDTQSRDPKEYVFDVWVFLPNGKRYPVIPPSSFIVALAVTLVPVS